MTKQERIKHLDRVIDMARRERNMLTYQFDQSMRVRDWLNLHPELPVRANSALYGRSSTTIADLNELGRQGLLRWRNVGRKTVDAVEETLRADGLLTDAWSAPKPYEHTQAWEKLHPYL